MSGPSSPALAAPTTPADGAGAEDVAAAVLAVPGVVGLSGGPLGTVATHLPGRRVSGVALRPDGSVEVAVVVGVTRRFDVDLARTAGRVAVAVAAACAVPASRVRVVVADVQLLTA